MLNRRKSSRLEKKEEERKLPVVGEQALTILSASVHILTSATFQDR